MAAPVANNVTYSVTTGRDYRNTWSNRITKNCSDADGDAITITAVATPTHGTMVTVGPLSGLFWYVADETYVGTASCGFTITAGGETATASMIFNCAEYSGIERTARDVEAFFKPVLTVHSELRYQVDRNGNLEVDASNYTNDITWIESTQRVVDMATNSSTEVDFGGVLQAAYVFVESETLVQVATSTAAGAGSWPCEGILALMRTDVQTLHITNESATDTATVRVTLCDEETK